jgi:[protein-PII] uridylyltransferase
MPQSLIPGLHSQLTQGQPPLDSFKACIKQSQEVLANRFHAGEPVADLVHARSEFIDELLLYAWQHHMSADSQAALVAVGGYGRGELHPASDIDLLILTAAEPVGELAGQLEQLVMFLWDMGLEVGHSVRTVDQCVEEATRDVTIVTNLMESRYLAGLESLFDAMRKATASDRIWPSDQFFRAKYEEQQRRHLKYDSTAYNLEPNIKSNPGGLRDIQMIDWVVKRHFSARRLSELVTHGFLTETEYKALKDGQSLLWKIRFALHLLTGRHDDRLLFEHQRTIAREFGYCDDSSNMAVEQFMQQYYLNVIKLNRLNEMLLQLFQEVLLIKSPTNPPVKINNRFQSTNGYLEVSNNGIFARYPLAMLELFLVLQENPELKGVRASTIRLIRAHRHLIDDKFRKDIRARSLFLEILRQPTGITTALRRMNLYGVLARYIPLFGNIVGRMQFDLFHVFTVDEHTLRLISNLRRFSIPKYSHEYPLCFRVFQQLVKPELIYLAGLFHDIAKGRGGSHAKLGARDAWDFCKLHDLSDYDARLVAWMVEQHLLMSTIAQRKDIDDPVVIQEFANIMGDTVRLDYLFLLTVADMRATNPNRWNSWKKSLMDSLYKYTRRALLRGLDNPLTQDELIQQKQAEAKRLLRQQGFTDDAIINLWMSLNLEYFLQNTPDELSWHSQQILTIDDAELPLVKLRPSNRRGCDEIFICTNNRDNLFGRATALIDQAGLNILEARIQTTDQDLTFNSYFVLENDGSHIESGLRAEEILQLIRTRLCDEDSMPGAVPANLPRRLKQFTTQASVSISQDPDNYRTLLQIQATDRPGLLSQIGKVFAEQGIRVHNARIATLRAIAEDTFYITDNKNEAITDTRQLITLEKGLCDELNEQAEDATA